MVPFQADTLEICLGEGDQDKATEGPQPGALGWFGRTCSDEYSPYLSQAPLPAGKHCFPESIHPGRAQGMKKITEAEGKGEVQSRSHGWGAG